MRGSKIDRFCFRATNSFSEGGLGETLFAERSYFKFRVRWTSDSHSLTYGGTLGCVRLARLLEILN
ncbi:MAG: hypothetical protein A2007_01770 [Verrucomicrobia bacterium GWC2_42_7]|nr:MAG: hypothetical protein A2007_01770 [Verrucomicrobia bacterium GWC2_42_7]